MAANSRSQLCAQGLIRPGPIGVIRRPLQLCQIDKMKPSVPIKTFEMKRCVVGIRRPGEPGPTPGKDSPIDWFPSMAKMATATLERPFARSA